MSANGVGAPPLPCADGVSNLASQVGAKMEGFRLPLTRRGVRTTLLNGVLMCIEVETSPRHHKHRRAPLCTPAPHANSTNRSTHPPRPPRRPHPRGPDPSPP